MATTIFLVRIELHAATPADYEALHAVMSGAGFSRSIGGVTIAQQQGTWLLPTGTYCIRLDGSSAAAVRQMAEGAASAIGFVVWHTAVALGTRTFELIVAEGNMAWNGLRSF